MTEAGEAWADLLARGKRGLEARDFASAAACFQRVVALGGDSGHVRYLEGEALCGLKEFALAVTAYEHGLALEPERASLHINLARALLYLGDPDRAVAHLERAAALGRALEAMERLAIIAPGAPACGPARLRDIRRQYGELLAASAPDWAVPEVRADSGMPIRVAYLSAHFSQPAYMGPVWALINHHDRAQVAVHLIADAPVTGPFTGYNRRADDTILDASDFTDLEIVQYVQDRGIDLLVDLSGYSYPKRLSLFARKPAPRVATWFNMYATSGLPGIDYIIGDAQVVPPEEEEHYTERVIRLPQSYLSFQGWDDRPDPVDPPCARGEGLTFGSLVSMYKITPPVVDAWSEILRATPRTRLVLGNAALDSADNRAWLLARFAERGADTTRIELWGSAPHAEFIRRYDAMDVALDAFPYSGGTTTMEAIWQGVPVLTQTGDRWAARTSASILADTHLEEFCRRDPADYVRFAIHLATDPSIPAWLARLRREMRPRLRTSRVMDSVGLAREMESCYRRICGPDPP